MSFLTVYVDQFLQSPWTQNVGWTLLHSLWQIALIAALYAVATVGLRNRSASLRYFFGCVAMVAMLVVPVATFCVLPNPLPEPVAAEPVVAALVESKSVEPNDSINPLLTTDQHRSVVSTGRGTPPMFGLGDSIRLIRLADSADTGLALQASEPAVVVERLSLFERVTLFVRPWLSVATVIWLVGVLLLSLRPVLGCLRVQTLRSNGLTPLAESHCQLAERLVERLGIRHAVQFAQSALVQVPTVIGYLRPMVLLPASSVTGLTATELELILAHELAHIRRHDYALNFLFKR